MRLFDKDPMRLRSKGSSKTLPNSSNATTRIPHETAILREQGVHRVLNLP